MSQRERRRRRKAPEDEAFTLGDFARLAGVALLLVALLMLTATPHAALEAWHRDGYVETTALITPIAVQSSKRVQVSIPSLGEEFHFTNRGAQLASSGPVRVRYNADARRMIALGSFRITLLDARVLPLSDQPLPAFAQEAGLLALNILALIGALVMIVQPRWRPRS